jgi:hypothetical protein
MSIYVECISWYLTSMCHLILHDTMEKGEPISVGPEEVSVQLQSTKQMAKMQSRCV